MEDDIERKSIILELAQAMRQSKSFPTEPISRNQQAENVTDDALHQSSETSAAQQSDKEPTVGRRIEAQNTADFFEEENIEGLCATRETEIMKLRRDFHRLQRDNENLRKESEEAKLYVKVTEKKICELEKKTAGKQDDSERIIRLKDEQLQELQSRISELEAQLANQVKQLQSPKQQRDESMKLTNKLRNRIPVDTGQVASKPKLLAWINKRFHSKSTTAESEPNQQLSSISFEQAAQTSRQTGQLVDSGRTAASKQKTKLENIIIDEQLAKCWSQGEQEMSLRHSQSSLEQETEPKTDAFNSKLEQLTKEGSDDSQFEEQIGEEVDDSRSQLDQQTGLKTDDSQSQFGLKTNDSQSQLDQQTGLKTDDSQTQLERLKLALDEKEAINRMLENQVDELRKQLVAIEAAVQTERKLFQAQKYYLNSYKQEIEMSNSVMQKMKATIIELTSRLALHADEFDKRLIEEKRKQEQLYRKMCEQSDLREKFEQQLVELKLEVALHAKQKTRPN